MNDHTSTTGASPSLIETKSHESDFIHFIKERLGIIIHPHQKNDLHKIIVAACKKFNFTPSEYLKKINESPDTSPLIEHLVIGITIGETYFFRDANQIRLLQETILPNLIKRKRGENNRILRIWSAGSSSGEEIYTIAMLLCDMLPDINAWTLNLLATDINTNALKKAIKGHYNEWSMRSIPERYKQRYFTLQKQQYVISSIISNMVNFDYLNLNDNTFPSILNDTNAQDLIICRNVLIYFDREHGAQLMKKLSACLVPSGNLILGASDPIYAEGTDLIFNFKLGPLFTRPTEQDLIKSKAKVKVETTPVKTTLPKTTSPTKKAPKQPPAAFVKEPALTVDELKTTVNTLLSEARWQEALATISNHRREVVKSAFFLSAEATALANIGKLDLAANCCYQSLSIDSTSIDTHFTLAMVLVELNRLADAEAELRKTLFLDHQFVMGHFQLGLLLIKNKQADAGLKCLKNALLIVKSKDPDQLVNGFQRVYYGHLAEILEHEIELHMTPKGMQYESKKQ